MLKSCSNNPSKHYCSDSHGFIRHYSTSLLTKNSRSSSLGWNIWWDAFARDTATTPAHSNSSVWGDSLSINDSGRFRWLERSISPRCQVFCLSMIVTANPPENMPNARLVSPPKFENRRIQPRNQLNLIIWFSQCSTQCNIDNIKIVLICQLIYGL